MLFANIYDLSREGSEPKVVKFPIEGNIDKVFRKVLKADENAEIYIDNVTLADRTALAWPDIDSRDSFYSDELKKLQSAAEITSEYDIKGLSDLYQAYIDKTGNVNQTYLKFTRYVEDSDLDDAFAGQKPTEILRNSGHINYSDDYISVDPSTAEVNTLTTHKYLEYLKDNAIDLINELRGEK